MKQVSTLTKPIIGNTGASDNPGTGNESTHKDKTRGGTKHRWKNQGNQVGEVHAGSWRKTLRMPRTRFNHRKITRTKKLIKKGDKNKRGKKICKRKKKLPDI